MSEGTAVSPFICFGGKYDTGVYIKATNTVAYAVHGQEVSFATFAAWCTREGKLNGLGLMAMEVATILMKEDKESPDA